jgi:amidase
LLPVAEQGVFTHDTTHPDRRMIPLPEGGAQPFWNLLSYISPATLTGCPATTIPVGLGRSGLPVGLQVMAAYLEDATPIAFARSLAEEIGGFQPPTGYELEGWPRETFAETPIWRPVPAGEVVGPLATYEE